MYASVQATTKRVLATLALAVHITFASYIIEIHNIFANRSDDQLEMLTLCHCPGCINELVGKGQHMNGNTDMQASLCLHGYITQHATILHEHPAS